MAFISGNAPWKRTGNDISYMDGNVGIGTTEPASLLEIEKSISRQQGAVALLTLDGIEASNTDLDAGDGVSMLFKIPYEGGISKIGASIAAVKNGIGDTDSTTDLVFSTSQNDETLDEAMRIDNNGNVGIGTTTFGAAAVTVLTLGNGTAPGALANTASIVSLVGELWAYDSGAVGTQLTSHPKEVMESSTHPFPFGFKSQNAYIGKEIIVDWTKLIASVENLTGESYHVINDIPKIDWDENLTNQLNDERERRIREKQDEEVEVTIAEAIEEVEVVEEIETDITESKFSLVDGKVHETITKVTEKVGTGNFVKQLKEGCRIDEKTGIVYSKKTRAEAEAIIVEPERLKMPAWMEKRLQETQQEVGIANYSR